MTGTTFTVAVGLAAFLFAASCARAESDDELKAIERAHVSVKEIREEYQRSLQEALRQGNLRRALPGCKIKDMRTGKMTVGRTSHRLRNPKNLPPQWTKPYLEKFSKAERAEIPPHLIVSLGDRKYGYLEPIFIEPICLRCHGKKLTNEVREALHTDYPNDQAVGFEVGEFRGLLWLEIRNEAK